MITFEAIDAGYGDSIIVRYMGDGGYERIILVDGGPKSAKQANGKTYKPILKRVLPRLLEIKDERDRNDADIMKGEEKLRLDLMVCTHIDDDHIAGIDAFFQMRDENPPAREVDFTHAPDLWFNSFSALLQTAVAGAAHASGKPQGLVQQSVDQGESLTRHARQSGTVINRSAAGGLIMSGHRPAGYGDAEIIVTNPNQKALDRLQKKWLDEVKSNSGLLALGGIEASMEWLKNDDSKPNLSSICMLISKDGRRILLTGDQRGDHVLEGLEENNLLDADGKLHVDIMKVPHHGAEANNQPVFHAAVTADIYVFCANGKDQNPDLVVLELIARHAGDGREFTMAFTSGDMAYVPKSGGKFEVRNGKEIRTLADAIAHLGTLPGASRITFEFRGADNQAAVKNEHALIYRLPPKN